MAAVLLSFWRTITGLAALIRILPVLTWSMAAFGIGLGVAWTEVGAGGIRWFDFLMVVAGGALFQGVVAHALNDITDDRSGTDRLSQGRLSGGTRVIRRGLLNDRDLYFIAALGLIASTMVTMVLASHLGLWVWWVFLVGAWSSSAYSIPPFRLAYRPFLGEWLCAWPATWVCVYGCGLILGGKPSSALVFGSTLHATMSIAWLMQHHLADIPADLAAQPTKLTTVAWVSRMFGVNASRWVAAAYFMAATFICWAGKAVFPWWWVCAICNFLCIVSAMLTQPRSIGSITSWQLVMMTLTICNALALAIGVVRP